MSFERRPKAAVADVEGGSCRLSTITDDSEENAAVKELPGEALLLPWPASSCMQTRNRCIPSPSSPRRVTRSAAKSAPLPLKLQVNASLLKEGDGEVMPTSLSSDLQSMRGFNTDLAHDSGQLKNPCRNSPHQAATAVETSNSRSSSLAPSQQRKNWELTRSAE